MRNQKDHLEMLSYNSTLSDYRQWKYVQDNTPDPVEEYIRSFASFPEGWNFGEGRPVNIELIVKAIDVYRFGKSLGFTGNAFPIGEGEIEISFSYQEHFIDVYLTNQLTIEYTYELGIGENYQEVEHIENISEVELHNKLISFEETVLCNSSELSTAGTIIGKSADSRVIASESVGMESLSLIKIASTKFMELQYAST
jgi:hypothetical protein